jgi:hypothetical protein
MLGAKIVPKDTARVSEIKKRLERLTHAETECDCNPVQLVSA